jgi:hypothetical protein
VAVVDENGWFSIVDRVKELIKYKGLQVAPAELEAVLLANPAIADAAVIPVADDECGEVPKAYVVARSPLTAEDVMAFVAERVSAYKKIASWSSSTAFRSRRPARSCVGCSWNASARPRPRARDRSAQLQQQQQNQPQRHRGHRGARHRLRTKSKIII